MTRKLQILLYGVAVYLAAFGGLFVFIPSTAAQFTKTAQDPSLDLLYGIYALIFALVAFLAAREKSADSKLSLIVLVLLVGHVVVFGYLLVAGKKAWAQAGAPVLVNALLASLLVWFRKEHKPTN